MYLQANEKTNYQIKFQSKNEKPQNLKFYIEGKDREYEKLEDIEKDLKGVIEGNKGIVINWEWKYDENKTNDLQDTKDGENIDRYNFLIYTIRK